MTTGKAPKKTTKAQRKPWRINAAGPLRKDAPRLSVAPCPETLAMFS
jgi:hypothetical protein